MTNEELTREVLKISEHQAKNDVEQKNILTIIEEMKEDIKSTKNLAEDVHIMAINMQNMQVTLEETSKKVDALSSQEFTEYKENKKMAKTNIISAVMGAICTCGLGLIGWLIKEFINRG